MYINGRQINYKYIIAINSFMCIITIFRLYNMEEVLFNIEEAQYGRSPLPHCKA